MVRIVARRLPVGAFVMWGAVTLIFLIVRWAPGDPATLLIGSDASPAEIAGLRESLGLNEPLWSQYLHYLGQVLTGDFGNSYRLDQPAMAVVLGRLPATLELTVAATVIAVLAGLTLGTIAGGRADRVADRLVSAITLGFQSFPTFWVGIMLILLLALTFQALPSAGSGTAAHLVMPAVTLALPFVAIVARLTRSSVAESMRELYVQTARSKGLTEPQVLVGHVLRNSLIPVVTVVALQFGALLGGAVVVENVFAWPGLGSLVVNAVANRDYAVVQAATLLIAGVIVVLNLVADLAYSALDPRIRLAGRP
ncbi:peptide ABC transporter permease [Microtetraspora sp. NBRC 13810]|uniref:ABC transporter permease n=1 Tax=Microtetraspora sp. NBRC 13810 TaxID=3030990 RepID=UPI0024A01E6D|nr:ABC transporter permease [Microtetraspora sp. NBRC 13810]GLW11708.1 peptide ABC transporter permease [Microtetraspora sp. NBRC 13810]